MTVGGIQNFPDYVIGNTVPLFSITCLELILEFVAGQFWGEKEFETLNI